MNFFKQLFHHCTFKPVRTEYALGHRKFYFYNPQGMDSSGYVIVLKDKEIIMQFEPETGIILITKCECGNESYSNAYTELEIK